MMKTAIVTDSTVYLPIEERERYNIHVVPISVHFDDATFEEEITLSLEKFYEIVHTTKKFPKTSQPSIGKFVEVYERLAKEYDEIVSIHISSGVSGTFDSALQAAQMVDTVKIYGFDSGVAGGPLAIFTIEAAKLAANGASAAQILARLEDLQTSLDAYFIVDDLIHLQRSGRLSVTSSIIGSILQIKPILHMKNKKIAVFEKVRTKRKALQRVKEILHQAVETYGELQAVVMHVNCEQQGRTWMEKLQSTYPTVHFKLAYFGPSLATHLGEGTLAISWMKK
jgi:DegV family protein with EDD domain